MARMGLRTRGPAGLRTFGPSSLGSMGCGTWPVANHLRGRVAPEEILIEQAAWEVRCGIIPLLFQPIKKLQRADLPCKRVRPQLTLFVGENFGHVVAFVGEGDECGMKRRGRCSAQAGADYL